MPLVRGCFGITVPVTASPCAGPPLVPLPPLHPRQDWYARPTLQRLCVLAAVRPDRLPSALSLLVADVLGPYASPSAPGLATLWSTSAVRGSLARMRVLRTADEQLWFPRYLRTLTRPRRCCICKLREPTLRQRWKAKPNECVLCLAHACHTGSEQELTCCLAAVSQRGQALVSVSLGQGQCEVAERAVEAARRSGAWLMLQNVHLVPRWLPTLLQMLAVPAGGTATGHRAVHPNFRLFLVAEAPDGTRASDVGLPLGLLRQATVVVHEASVGMGASLREGLAVVGLTRARGTLTTAASVEPVENGTPARLRFVLAWFHACLTGRRRLGAQVWTHRLPRQACCGHAHG